MSQLNNAMTARVNFSQTEDEEISEILEENNGITGTLTVEFWKGKAVFTPDVVQNGLNGLCSNVIIDCCVSIEINNADGEITIFNENGKWLFEIEETER